VKLKPIGLNEQEILEDRIKSYKILRVFLIVVLLFLFIYFFLIYFKVLDITSTFAKYFVIGLFIIIIIFYFLVVWKLKSMGREQFQKKLVDGQSITT
jgi:hypothetical protein